MLARGPARRWTGTRASSASTARALRLVGHRGRAPRRAAGRRRATSSRSTPPRWSRPRSRRSSSPATTLRARRAVRAFEWFLGRNRLQRSVYDFATGGCHDGLGESDVNGNEGAESTLAYLQALLALDARRPPGDAARMKVALLGPIAWRTPPRHYGPWELVTGLLADGLAPRGVDVTLFATLDSITARAARRRLRAAVRGGPRRSTAGSGRRCTSRTRSSRSAEFDLVHNHLDWLPLAFSALARAPMVTTIHGFSSPRILPAYRRSAQRLRLDLRRRPRRRSSTTSRRSTTASTSTALPFSATAGDGLVCFGRIHPDKGTAEAIEIARARRAAARALRDRAGRALLRRGGRAAHRRRPRALPRLGRPRRSAPRSSARPRCLLHPIAFAEPFGLSVVEAMLCGTPVVAYPRGSMPEIVDDGVTGFLVARRRLGGRRPSSAAPRFDRAACRRAAERRFSADRMVDDYLDVYERRPPVTDSATLFTRHPGNPLLTPERWPYSINAVHERRARRTVDDETVLLCRVEDRRGFSHLTCARSQRRRVQLGRRRPARARLRRLASRGGVGARGPARHLRRGARRAGSSPTPRSAPSGPGVSLAQTEDFRTFERLGHGHVAGGQERRPAAAPDRRRLGAVPPARRPSHGADVWLSRSSDLKSWRSPEPVLGRRAGRLVGLGPHRHGPAAARDRARLARRLPRRAPDRRRRAVPRRPRAARPRRPGARPAALGGVGARARRRLRGLGRRPERRVPVRPRAPPRHRRAVPVLRRGRHAHRPRDRAAAADVLDYLLACPPG